MKEKTALLPVGFVARIRSVATRKVALRRFNLDHLRTHISKKFGAIGASDERSILDDLDVLECGTRHGHQGYEAWASITVGLNPLGGDAA